MKLNQKITSTTRIGRFLLLDKAGEELVTLFPWTKETGFVASTRMERKEFELSTQHGMKGAVKRNGEPYIGTVFDHTGCVLFTDITFADEFYYKKEEVEEEQAIRDPHAHLGEDGLWYRYVRIVSRFSDVKLATNFVYKGSQLHLMQIKIKIPEEVAAAACLLNQW